MILERVVPESLRHFSAHASPEAAHGGARHSADAVEEDTIEAPVSTPVWSAARQPPTISSASAGADFRTFAAPPSVPFTAPLRWDKTLPNWDDFFAAFFLVDFLLAAFFGHARAAQARAQRLARGDPVRRMGPALRQGVARERVDSPCSALSSLFTRQTVNQPRQHDPGATFASRTERLMRHREEGHPRSEPTLSGPSPQTCLPQEARELQTQP